MIRFLIALIRAISKAIVLSGVIHIVALVVISIRTRSISYLNPLTILSLDLLIPQVKDIPMGIVVSWAFIILVILGLIYYEIKKK